MIGEITEDRVNPRIPLSIGVAAILLCVLFLAGTDTFAGGTLSGFGVKSASQTERVVIGVEGMYCDSCAAGIKAMLKRTPGVIASEVSYQKKEAIVDYDSQKTTQEKIVEAVNNLGYKASVKNKS